MPLRGSLSLSLSLGLGQTGSVSMVPWGGSSL
jgi:hypothetical protein